MTGRVDTTSTFRPRNTTTGPRLRHEPRPPAPSDRLRREPLRASQPNGPLSRRRQRNFRPPEPPSLEAARAWPIEFGKFHGHTLGAVADFEPTYIDWLARTISRDPDLVAAARVLQDDLDVRGILRYPRPASLVRPTGLRRAAAVPRGRAPPVDRRGGMRRPRPDRLAEPGVPDRRRPRPRHAAAARSRCCRGA